MTFEEIKRFADENAPKCAPRPIGSAPARVAWFKDANAIAARAEADDANRELQVRKERMSAALRAGQVAAGVVAPFEDVEHSADYWHEDDGDAAADWTPNRAMDVNDRELGFVDYAVEETGQSCTDEKQTEMVRRFEELQAQSHALAETLETVGVPAYRQTPFGLWSYAVHSRTVRKLPNFRRIALLPSVAQHLRGPMVSALEYFLEKHPYCRFWTFTSGSRVPLRIPACGPAEPLVRNRIAYLNRKISKLNDREFMKEAGLQIVFRSDEFGTPETVDGNDTGANSGRIDRDEAGNVTFHIHAHCVVWPSKGFIPPKKWALILEKVKHFWGHNWDEGGAITTAREACKYVTKPAEMLKLTPAELAELFRQSRRMKLCQPLGALAKEIKQRKESGLRLVKKAAPHGEGRVYHAVQDWNKQRKRTTAEADGDAAKALDSKETGEFFRIIARSVPSFCGAGLKECRVTVMASVWDESKVRAHPDVARLIEATSEAWQAGLFIRVHTCTPTVPGELAPETVSQRLLPEMAAT